MALPQLIADSPTPGADALLTTLSGNGGSITSGAASMNWAAAPSTLSALGAVGQFDVLVDSEIIRCAGGSSTTVTIITRGVDGSTAAAHNDGAQVKLYLTAGALQNLLAQAATGLQNGVIGSAELLIGTISIATGTCALTFTPAATGTLPAFVKSTSGLLVPTGYAGGAKTITPTAPASTKYAVIGVEIDTTGAIALVKGADTATQLNTAALIATNSPAITSGKLRIADLAVWNNAGTYNFSDHTTVATQGVNWIDRRPWARGAKGRIVRTLNAAGTSDYTTTSVSVVAIDATNMLMRLECTGNPMVVRLSGITTAGNGVAENFVPWVDGAAVDGMTFTFSETGTSFSVADVPMVLEWETIPAAGSHSFQWAWSTASGTLKLFADATIACEFTVEEIVRPNATNGSA